ncbi:DUF1380 domain-containing protein [Serratia fonticola]|uniref:DUF1380 domain-containing protein n=1 Tax=Serratia fonticola TaxID=47917 RepID=UPI001F3F3E26|nr:DUF1380 domain-containing protein [Serratia fonticola]
MFGSVKEVCAELFREYGSDEPITVLIWDAHAVRYFAQEWNPNDGDVLAILETIGCSDKRYGINQQYIQDAITKIADSRSRTRQVEVSASALETVLELAAITIDIDDPESWDVHIQGTMCYRGVAGRVTSLGYHHKGPSERRPACPAYFGRAEKPCQPPSASGYRRWRLRRPLSLLCVGLFRWVGHDGLSSWSSDASCFCIFGDGALY